MALRGMLMTVVGLVSGSLMFSAWLARLTGADVRRVGDGNPGAVNACLKVFNQKGYQLQE